MELQFPPTGGGSDNGFNHPGIETFGGKVGHYIAREFAQNTIDATVGSEVHLAFDLIDVPASSLPVLDELKDVVGRCGDFYPSNDKAREFSTHALNLLSQDIIKVLKVSDYGTKGLVGNDGDRDSAWYGLVKSTGVSNKHEGQGGSFGIGKYAPFAASCVRTVLYSTLVNEDRSVAFQGVSVLWSHEGDDGKVRQGTGYIGVHDEEQEVFRAVRNNEDVPELFRRDEPGTDVWILGYGDGDSDTWEKDLMHSVLQNFWPAIRRKIVRFTIGGRNVSSENLKEMLEIFSSEPKFTAHNYFKAATVAGVKTFERDFEKIGSVKLQLFTKEEPLPKKIALVRKTGMVIEERMFHCRKPYAGFLECVEEPGNGFFREMEPPRHDCLDVDRLPKRSPERKEFKAFEDWLRECVRELNPIASDEAMDVPELSRFLPDEGEEEQTTETSAVSETEDFSFMPKPPQGEVEVQVQQPLSGSLSIQSMGGDDPGENGEGALGEGEPNPTNESSNSKGGKNEQGGSGNEKDKEVPDPIPSISMRSYAKAENVYSMIVHADGDFGGNIKVFAVGEDGRREPVGIQSATTADGASLCVDGVNVYDVSLDQNTPLRIDVELKHGERVALDCELAR